MPDDSDPEQMDVEEMNETQFSSASSGGPGTPPDENITSIYARQYEAVQKIHQEGSTSLESIAQVQELVKQSSILCQREKKVRESLFGSSVLSFCAQISSHQAQALDTNLCAFDLQSFADGILSHATNQETQILDWKLLEKRTGGMFKRAPVVSYMYGSFKPTELPRKETKEKTKRQNRVAAEKKEPEKVSNVASSDDGNDKAVQHVKKILSKIFRNNGNQPISFFECVLDPKFFHLTVENIFHLSFLLKNNFCTIKQQDGGLPFIHPVPTSQVNELQKGKKLQCIASISPELWETLVKVFNIKEAMIPPFT